ncbi:unnamed protein product [Cochlearia groenlandica]
MQKPPQFIITRPNSSKGKVKPSTTKSCTTKLRQSISTMNAKASSFTTRASRSILSSTFGQDLASQRPPLNHQLTRPKSLRAFINHSVKLLQRSKTNPSIPSTLGSVKFLATTKPSHPCSRKRPIINHDQSALIILGLATIKCKAKYLLLGLSIYQELSQKTQTNLVPIAQRTKPQDLMKKSKGSSQMQLQGIINLAYLYKLKAVQRSGRPKARRKSQRRNKREGKEVTTFLVKSHIEACEEQAVKTKSKK